MDQSLARRVLMLLPTQRDTELTSDVLAKHGIDTCICRQHADLAREIERGAAAVLVAEEALLQGAQSVLSRAIERQPRWSDLPVLVVARDGADSVQVADAMARLGNVTLLERPLRLSTLISTVRSALRARERQYQMLTHLDELETARDAIAASAQRKDEFLAMLAHELRNPLAPIRNALHLLDQGTMPEQERVPLRAMMKRQVDHMVRLVDDLVEVSRLSRGTIELRRDVVELADVLRNAIDLSRPLIDTGRHALHLDLPDGALPVDADPVRLAQVFGNLLNNAAKYARSGGEIRVRARREGGEVVVSVRDRGIGIEPDVLPHVFELFTQGRREAHRAQDGLGIGLTLVRSLVEMHGGTVTAHSEGRGRGAEFTVRLPLATAQIGTSDPSPVESRAASDDDAAGASHPCACWSWTTTSTRRARWAWCCRCSRSSTKCASTARRRWTPCADADPTRCCWTSACPAWTGTKSPGSCTTTRPTRTYRWWRSPVGASSRTRSAPSRPASATTSASRWTSVHCRRCWASFAHPTVGTRQTRATAMAMAMARTRER